MARYSCAVILSLFALMLEPISARADPLQDAKTAYENLQYAVAFQIWNALAEQGNAEAQTRLSSMYFNGEGVPKDYERSLYWANKAAIQGNAEAEYDAG